MFDLKLSRPKIIWTKIFFDPHILEPKIFWAQNLLQTQIDFGPKIVLRLKLFYGPKNFNYPEIFIGSNKCLT